jgi:hypothetical protein
MVSHHVGISGLPGISFAPVCWFDADAELSPTLALPGVS